MSMFMWLRCCCPAPPAALSCSIPGGCRGAQPCRYRAACLDSADAVAESSLRSNIRTSSRLSRCGCGGLGLAPVHLMQYREVQTMLGLDAGLVRLAVYDA